MNIDEYMAKLHEESPEEAAMPPRIVRKTDGTTEESFAKRPKEEEVDALFGQTPGYSRYKKELPEHRIMLWHRLRGTSPKDIAAIMGYSYPTVIQVSKQPWFQEAFCRLSTEIGKDVVTNFLEGEIVPTLQRLVALRDGAETDAVKKAACDSILDRVRGKPVAKVDIKSTATLDVAVYDAEKLLAEQQRLAQTLRDRGVGTN